MSFLPPLAGAGAAAGGSAAAGSAAAGGAAAAGAGAGAVAGGSAAAAAGSTALMEALAAGGLTNLAGTTFPVAASSISMGTAGWLGTLAKGFNFGGTLLTMASKWKKSKAESDALEASAEAAEAQAVSRQEQTKAEQFRLSRLRRKILGAQRAAIGASGSAFEGAPTDFMRSTLQDIERDILLQARAGHLSESRSLYQANVYRSMARSRRRTGMIGAGGTLLSGFARPLLY